MEHARVVSPSELIRRRHPRAPFTDYGYIAGTVQVEGAPVRRRVRCIERKTGRFIAETWSGINGAYRFDDLVPGRQYLIVAMDYELLYNAVVADNVLPAVGPPELVPEPDEELMAPALAGVFYDEASQINRLFWANTNHTQQAVRIYRTATPEPPGVNDDPIIELGAFARTYDDPVGISPPEYYYHVAAVQDGEEAISAPAAEADRYWQSVVLCAAFEGPNGSTEFTDDTGRHTLEVVGFSGVCELRTNKSKLGGSSLYISGGSRHLSIPNSVDWAFGSGDFTVELFVSIEEVPNTYYGLINQTTSTTSNNSWKIITLNSLAGTAAQASETGNANTHALENRAEPTVLGQWAHHAFVRHDDTLLYFVNGTLVVTRTIGQAEIFTSSAALKIGEFSNRVLEAYYDGVRITKGVARYTTEFTPPENAYPTFGPRVPM